MTDVDALRGAALNLWHQCGKEGWYRKHPTLMDAMERALMDTSPPQPEPPAPEPPASEKCQYCDGRGHSPSGKSLCSHCGGSGKADPPKEPRGIRIDGVDPDFDAVEPEGLDHDC